MPTNRRVRQRTVQFQFTKQAAVHLLLGDCLFSGQGRLACGCGLRDAQGSFVAELGADLWKKHRTRVMKLWVDRPYPCFAQVVFDGQRLPAGPLTAWSQSAQGEYRIVAEEVALARE